MRSDINHIKASVAADRLMQKHAIGDGLLGRIEELVGNTASSAGGSIKSLLGNSTARNALLGAGGGAAIGALGSLRRDPKDRHTMSDALRGAIGGAAVAGGGTAAIKNWDKLKPALGISGSNGLTDRQMLDFTENPGKARELLNPSDSSGSLSDVINTGSSLAGGAAGSYLVPGAAAANAAVRGGAAYNNWRATGKPGGFLNVTNAEQMIKSLEDKGDDASKAIAKQLRAMPAHYQDKFMRSARHLAGDKSFDFARAINDPHYFRGPGDPLNTLVGKSQGTVTPRPTSATERRFRQFNDIRRRIVDGIPTGGKGPKIDPNTFAPGNLEVIAKGERNRLTPNYRRGGLDQRGGWNLSGAGRQAGKIPWRSAAAVPATMALQYGALTPLANYLKQQRSLTDAERQQLIEMYGGN